MTYTFDNTTSGCAAGVITAPDSNKPYILLYYADDRDILADFDELACVPSGGRISIKPYTAIPPTATRLAAFASDTRFLDIPPSITDAIDILPLPAYKLTDRCTPLWSFGLVADVHMNYQAHGRGAYEKWSAALAFFAAHNTDAVIVAGDVTGDAFEGAIDEQFETYNHIIAASPYPRENIYEGMGNHGNTAEGRTAFVAQLRGSHREHAFDGSPWYAVSIHNTRFVFLSQEIDAPGETAHRENFSKAQIDWLERELTADYEHIIIVCHPPFLGVGPGDRKGGSYRGMVVFDDEYEQTMRLKCLLEAHKEVIVVSGHSHLSFYDGENVGDENGAFCRMVHIGSTCQPTSYGDGDRLIRSFDGRHAVTPTYGSEGYLVHVCEGGLLFEGYNLSTGKRIAKAHLFLPTNSQSL